MPIESNTGEWVPPVKLPWRTRALLAESEEGRLRAEIETAKAALAGDQKLIDRQRAENERLRAALAKGRTLVNDMDELMPSEATEDEDGFIASYRIPVGPWHRILGWARGANYGD